MGITSESAKLRWLLARITGPVAGTFSIPVTVGRHTTLASGGTTACRTPYITGPVWRLPAGPPIPSAGCTLAGLAGAPAIQHRMRALIDEEHRLRDALTDGGISLDEEHQRLERVEVELDQCWDLLRQRRARREHGQAAEQATVRSEGTVENYRQ